MLIVPRELMFFSETCARQVQQEAADLIFKSLHSRTREKERVMNATTTQRCLRTISDPYVCIVQQASSLPLRISALSPSSSLASTAFHSTIQEQLV